MGFGSLPSLLPQKTLKVLRKINRIIRSRLILNDIIPNGFVADYRVTDGRVKFTVPSEFEVDLSIAEESPSSQFFFIDIKFLFSPISRRTRRKLLNTLDQ